MQQLIITTHKLGWFILFEYEKEEVDAEANVFSTNQTLLGFDQTYKFYI